jgi:hypothetical protein
MGYAGNVEPQFIVPTAIAAKKVDINKAANLDDLDFHIGDEAEPYSKTFGVQYPVRKGQVDNWTQMEQVCFPFNTFSLSFSCFRSGSTAYSSTCVQSLRTTTSA